MAERYAALLAGLPGRSAELQAAAERWWADPSAEGRASRAAAGAGALAAAAAAGGLLAYRRATAGPVEVGTPEELAALAARGVAFRLLAAPAARAVRVRGGGSAVPALPRAVCGLRRLRELDLSGGAIEAVPPAVGGLRALTRLALAGNRIEVLPPELGRLTRLVELDVSRNALRELPDSIGDLASLEALNAMGNALAALPPSVGRLSRLRRLGLKDNALERLPPEIGRLGALRELFLTGNRLVELPPEVGGLTSLVKLQASFNALASLPAKLGALPRLELLRVACCELREVPPAVAAAPSLAWLSLAGNPVCRPPPRRGGVPEARWPDVELGDKLGDGASGEVFAGRWARRGVAVKVFRADRSPDGHSRDEMAVAAALDSPHLVRVLATARAPLGLVMERVPGAPLAEKPNHESLLRCRWAPGALYALPAVLRVAAGVAAALEHMHRRGYAHGDVYAHNVLADADASSVVLCDYGAAFAYARGGRAGAAYEGHDARAWALLVEDLVSRADLGFEGLDVCLGAQRELLALARAARTGPPERRPRFGALAGRCRVLLKQVAGGGGGASPPRTGPRDAAAAGGAKDARPGLATAR